MDHSSGAAQERSAGLQFAQARAILDAGFRLSIARKLTCARIRNQRTQLMRLNRNRDHPDVCNALRDMLRTLRKADAIDSVERCLGIEGSASAIYWPALGRLINDRPDSLLHRSRPGRDPINTTINYLTGILERDIRAAIHGAGLHPGFAFLHGSRDYHDGLVFDLMEPFRAPLTEGIAVFQMNARRVTNEMFSDDMNGALRISDEGRRAIVLGYETAVGRRVNKTDGKGKLAWCPMMLHQVHGLAKAIRSNDADLFVPYLMEA